MIPERLVRFRPRAILSAVAVLLAVAVVLYILWISRRILSWVFIALFLALAINPAVEWLTDHHVPRRGAAVGLIFALVLVMLGVGGALVVPTLVTQTTDFVQAVPGYVRDLTEGRGPLGFLQTRYDIVDRVQRAVGEGGSGGISSGAGVVVEAGRTVVEGIAATITIVFMTLFMLLEGPAWIDRGFGLMAPGSRDRWRRVGGGVYRTISGYVVGNLLISVICGLAYGTILAVLGVPFPIALGFIVAVLDLIPLAGATVGGVIVILAAFATSTTAGLVMVGFVSLYQLAENHILQPIVYGRTVNLSPLVVLVSILIGSQVAGVLGALGAIPVAGALQVVLLDQLEHRRAKREAAEAADEPQRQSGVAAVS